MILPNATLTGCDDVGRTSASSNRSPWRSRIDTDEAPQLQRDPAAEHRDAAGITADATFSAGWKGLDERPASIEDEQLVRGPVRRRDDERASGGLGSRRARRDGKRHQIALHVPIRFMFNPLSAPHSGDAVDITAARANVPARDSGRQLGREDVDGFDRRGMCEELGGACEKRGKRVVRQGCA